MRKRQWPPEETEGAMLKKAPVNRLNGLLSFRRFFRLWQGDVQFQYGNIVTFLLELNL
jgi:hypothetical protein